MHQKFGWERLDENVVVQVVVENKKIHFSIHFET